MVSKIKSSMYTHLLKYKTPFLVLLVVASMALYFPLNRERGAVVTTLTGPLESIIPVIPAFSLPYLLFLPIFFLTFMYALVSKRDFTRLALVIFVICICSDIAYFLFQTYVPRPQIIGNGFFDQLLGYIYSHDQPFNDFPSEHAAFATVLALYCWSLRTKYWQIVLIFCLSVICATVFTKQHSFLGASCGVSLALATWYAVSIILKRIHKARETAL